MSIHHITLVSALLVVTSTGNVFASETCGQFRSYAQSAFEAYQTGATKLELYDRAAAHAGGDETARTLMVNIVDRGIRADSVGDAGREGYTLCKQLGL
jgi:hypothetical protein